MASPTFRDGTSKLPKTITNRPSLWSGQQQQNRQKLSPAKKNYHWNAIGQLLSFTGIQWPLYSRSFFFAGICRAFCPPHFDQADKIERKSANTVHFRFIVCSFSPPVAGYTKYSQNSLLAALRSDFSGYIDCRARAVFLHCSLSAVRCVTSMHILSHSPARVNARLRTYRRRLSKTQPDRKGCGA